MLIPNNIWCKLKLTFFKIYLNILLELSLGDIQELRLQIFALIPSIVFFNNQIVFFNNQSTNAVAYGHAHYGDGTGPIYFDELGCTGSEPNLFSCLHYPLGYHDCSHGEDAGVQCGKELS